MAPVFHGEQTVYEKVTRLLCFFLNHSPCLLLGVPSPRLTTIHLHVHSTSNKRINQVYISLHPSMQLPNYTHRSLSSLFTLIRNDLDFPSERTSTLAHGQLGIPDTVILPISQCKHTTT